MANHQRIGALVVELALVTKGNRYILEGMTRFKGKRRDNGNLLMRYEGGKWVLELGTDSLYGI